MFFVLFLAWMWFRMMLIESRNNFLYQLAHYYFETMNYILIAQLPKEFLLLFRGISYRKLLMTHKSLKFQCEGWQKLVLLSQFYQNISFRFLHLSAPKCQNPMKFQNEMANTGCTLEFSKIIYSHSYLVQQIFLQVS